MTELPKVATNFYHTCKKCGEERYHKVLSHPTASSAKIECEVCKSKKTFKLEKPKKAKSSATGKKKVARKKSSANQWIDFHEKVGAAGAVKYNMLAGFAPESVIDHPKFGIGYVLESHIGKIEVVFKDGSRSLVQNRGDASN